MFILVWQMILQHAMTMASKICGSLVGAHGASDPAGIVADLGIDTRIIPLGTAVTPGHDTLKLVVAHHGATGVTLQSRSVSEKSIIATKITFTYLLA